MKRTLNGKIVLFFMLILWVTVVRCLTGCSQEKEPEKLRDLDFTVVGDQEVPEELKSMIQEKKASPFKLTYTDEQGLYIVEGYGEQPTGGYSIAVQEMYLTENAIMFRAELMGPEKGEDAGNEKSYPYIVVKTEFLEEPVVFQ